MVITVLGKDTHLDLKTVRERNYAFLLRLSIGLACLIPRGPGNLLSVPSVLEIIPRVFFTGFLRLGYAPL